ncbi:single-stranded DNA-binding protein [Candidatus Woesebacteria bacterium]|nr:single-stranded DNA-binding protein [Candidatus Woesebacteria bacterium]
MASARSENLAILIGNLTRDPNLRYTSSGTAVADFGIATNRVWTTPDGDQREEVEFHQIVAWNKLAEICQQLLSKGDKVYIRGSLRTRTWEDDNGTKHYRTEIKAEDMKLLYSKSNKSYSSNDDDIASSDDDFEDFDMSDLDDSKSDDKKI